MKTKGLFLALALLTAMGVAAREKEVKGNGKLVTKEVEVAPFESIRIDLEGRKKHKWQFFGKEEDVRKDEKGCFLYSQTVGDAALSVTIDENLFQFLEITSSGGVLTVSANAKIKPGKLEIAASSASLKEVRVSGSANFGVATPLSVNNLSITVSGSGNVVMPHPVRVGAYTISVSGSGNLNAGNLVCSKISGSISGSGNFNLAGEADEAKFSISGSGNINALDFEVKKMDVSVSGSGNINTYVSEALKVRVSGSGDVKYKGNPTSLHIDSSGSGSVKTVD